MAVERHVHAAQKSRSGVLFGAGTKHKPWQAAHDGTTSACAKLLVMQSGLGMVFSSDKLTAGVLRESEKVSQACRKQIPISCILSGRGSRVRLNSGYW